MEDALKSKPEGVFGHYETQLNARQETCGQVMAELITRDSGNACRQRITRHDSAHSAGHDLAGSEGRRIYGSDEQTLSLVSVSSLPRVLQAGQVGTEGSRALRRADKATDRSGFHVWLPNRGGHAAVQPELSTADLPA